MDVSCEISAENMHKFIRDVIDIRLDMFINSNICFAILYGSIMLYIYKKDVHRKYGSHNQCAVV